MAFVGNLIMTNYKNKSNRRVTLADVANAAGVSMMTVSRVVNNKPGISAETHKRIMNLVKELGYRPNQIARSLATDHTKTIGVVVPDNTNPFFAQIAYGIEDEAYDQDYAIFLINTKEDAKRELRALDTLWQKDVDGLILCSSRLGKKELEVQIRNFSAVVLLNRDLDKDLTNTTTINIDDKLGAELAIDHLLKNNRMQIAHIRGPENSTSANRRMEGYQRALNEANISFNPELTISCFPDINGGRRAATILLQRNMEIDGIYAYNDLVAVGAVQICQEYGKHVPEDIAVVGVDDSPIATLIRPKLTTLHIDLKQTGKLAMQILLKRVEENASPENILLDPELYLRESA